MLPEGHGQVLMLRVVADGWGLDVPWTIPSVQGTSYTTRNNSQKTRAIYPTLPEGHGQVLMPIAVANGWMRLLMHWHLCQHFVSKALYIAEWPVEALKMLSGELLRIVH